jgi:hypothetical protein
MAHFCPFAAESRPCTLVTQRCSNGDAELSSKTLPPFRFLGRSGQFFWRCAAGHPRQPLGGPPNGRRGALKGVPGSPEGELIERSAIGSVMSAEEARAPALDALRARLSVVSRQDVARVEVASLSAPAPAPAAKPKTKPATLQAVFNVYRNTRTLKSSTADDYQKVFNRYAADWLERSWLATT